VVDGWTREVRSKGFKGIQRWCLMANHAAWLHYDTDRWASMIRSGPKLIRVKLMNTSVMQLDPNFHFPP
jgi:hypothetical protein